MTLAHLTLATRDVAATAEFYRHIFRWNNTAKAKNSAIDVEWLDIGQGQQLHIIGVPDFEISASEGEYGRHIAFFVPAIELASLKQRLAGRGARLCDAERPTPFERFFFTDPNGYTIEVIDQDAWSE
ncbi:MAG: VOC family protein [Verrucomicrobiales bacterium]